MILSLCSGIGGLDLAAEAMTGQAVGWHAEHDPHASRVLARHWPNVPNLGDVKHLPFDDLTGADVICAGYPCQPFSTAGKRKGTDDPRHLWPWIAGAVRALRPRLVLLENVSAHLSLGFGSVVGDLAALGYDARWCCVRAVDVGAPHGRRRLFIAAYPGGPSGDEGTDGQDGADLARGGGEAAPDSSGDGCGGGTLDDRAAPQGRVPVPAGGHADRRDVEAASDADGAGLEGRQPAQGRLVPARGATAVADSSHLGPADSVDFGPYAPAVARWADILGRPVPAPLDHKRRLNVDFVEWMMGYPQGWVDGLTRTAALRCLGNAVVTDQAIHAYRLLEAS